MDSAHPFQVNGYDHARFSMQDAIVSSAIVARARPRRSMPLAGDAVDLLGDALGTLVYAQVAAHAVSVP